MENAPADKATALTIDQTVERIRTLNRAANDAVAEASRLRRDLVARLRDAGIDVRGVSASPNPSVEGGFFQLSDARKGATGVPTSGPVSSLVEAILGGRFA